jgi:hypothetical protein
MNPMTLIWTRLAVIFALVVPFTGQAAEETCVIEAGISQIDGELSYMTPGPSGNAENPIIPLNEEVAETLEKAAQDLRTNVWICMKGSVLRIGKASRYMVYSASRKPLQAQPAPESGSSQ